MCVCVCVQTIDVEIWRLHSCHARGIKRLLINAHRSVPRVETDALCIKYILISAISILFLYRSCHVWKWFPTIVTVKSIILDARVVEIKQHFFTYHISLSCSWNFLQYSALCIILLNSLYYALPRYSNANTGSPNSRDNPFKTPVEAELAKWCNRTIKRQRLQLYAASLKHQRSKYIQSRRLSCRKGNAWRSPVTSQRKYTSTRCTVGVSEFAPFESSQLCASSPAKCPTPRFL